MLYLLILSLTNLSILTDDYLSTTGEPPWDFLSVLTVWGLFFWTEDRLWSEFLFWGVGLWERACKYWSTTAMFPLWESLCLDPEFEPIDFLSTFLILVSGTVVNAVFGRFGCIIWKDLSIACSCMTPKPASICLLASKWTGSWFFFLFLWLKVT